MKALTVRQPWASLIVHGPKWIWTQAQPTDVRGRIGIVAALHRPKDGTIVGDYEMVRWSYPGGVSGWSLMHDSQEVIGSLPFGALIGTVELYDCVPILDSLTAEEMDQDDQEPFIASEPPYSAWAYASADDRVGYSVVDQLPYGDFRPGRWAWLLRDPQPCTPVPMRGFPGFREIQE